MVWVGIGASAGGLEALQGLAANLPQQANATYIVAQHLSPRHQTALVQLIQRVTPLKVEEARHQQIPQPNTIYITPPNKDILVANRRLCLASPGGEHHPKPSADTLFRSMAEQLGNHAIGVVLSGTGTDGARGVAAIRAAGGITIAQDEASAKYDGMPKAAVDTGCVDVVLEPAAIAAHIEKVVTKFPVAANLIDADASHRDGLSELIQLIHKRTRVNLRDYKKATLKRRIERRMLARGMVSFDDYLAFARGNEAEVDLLFQDILISVTEFYRDRKAFDALAKVVQSIVDGKQPHEPIRVWVVGCATGEEVYTVAMLFAEACGGLHRLDSRSLQFFATDIDTQALAKARKGCYPRSSILTLPEPLQKRYFRVAGDVAEVVKPLRDLVLFSKHNVIQDPPFMRIDLICCRNLLIYFQNELQKRVYHLFHYALVPDGYLFLGKSESTLQASELFRSQDTPAKIFRKRQDVFEDQPAIGRHLAYGTGRGVKPAPQAAPVTPSRDAEALFEALVAQLADAAVLVNENLDVEWVYGELTPFVRIRQGRPKLNLVDMVGDAHRDEIRAMAYKAARERLPIRGQPRKLLVEGLPMRSEVVVYPVDVHGHEGGRLLVAFRKLPPGEVPAAQGDGVPGSATQELEHELAAAREHLQTVIEELETSNEELQSVNEELQSTNEELQSANEELETANEELQSTNEELVTVNDELNAKAMDLERVSTRLRQIEDSLDFPLLVLDERCRVTTSNEAAAQHFRIAPGTARLQDILPAFCEPDEVERTTREVIADGAIRTMHLDCETQSYWLRIVPLRQADGAIGGAVHSYIDYTARRAGEKQLAAARSAAEQANAAKTAVIANINHDIRTPLSAVSGGVHILRNFPVDEDKRDALLAMIERGADELRQLTDEFLDFARLEAGKLELNSADLRLAELVERVAELVRLRVEAKGLRFELSVAPDLPAYVLGDALKLRQVLLNLLANALKFTHQGTIALAVSAGPSRPGHREIVFVVSDTGGGIRADALDSIFDRFVQGTDPLEQRNGHGLGLTICRQLVDLMGGTIGVESRPGAGSTFTVRIPMRVDMAPPLEAGPPGEVAPLFTDAADARRRRVLVVEDNPGNTTILSAYLQYLGVCYDVVATGRDAIDACARTRYAAVLMDLHLPDISGFEAAAAIQAQSGDAPAIIAATAHAHGRVQERAVDLGMRHFLKKPLDFQELRAALHAVLAPAAVAGHA